MVLPLRVRWAAALCALSFAAVWVAQRAAHVSLIDVMVYRAAGQTVRAGGDLYAMRATPAMLPMTYPPFAGLLFVPLTWLGVAPMRTAVTAGNLLLTVVLAALSLRLVLRRRPGAAAVLGTAAGAVWSEPVWSTLRYGQVNILLVCLVLWDFTRRPDSRLAGAGTGLAAAIKVTPLLFLVVLAGAAVATRGQGTCWLRRLLTAAGTFAGATLLAAAALPHDSLRYWTDCAFAPGRSGSAVNVANQSVRGIVARAQHTPHPTAVWLVLAVLVAALGTAVAVAALAAGPRLPRGTAWAVVAAGVTSLLVSPISWTHHWVWDVPLVVLVCYEALQRRTPGWYAGAAACVVAFCCAAMWMLPHGPGSPELRENAAQILVAALYPLAGIAFLATAAAVTPGWSVARLKRPGFGRGARTEPAGAPRGGLAREAVRFCAVGAAGVLVNLGVYNLLRHYTSLLVVQAGAIATLAAIAFNYVGLRFFTYRDCDPRRRLRRITLFLAFSVVGAAIENGVFYGETRGLGWSSPLRSSTGKVVGIALATAFRFWAYRTWVFTFLPAARETPRPAADEGS